MEVVTCKTFLLKKKSFEWGGPSIRGNFICCSTSLFVRKKHKLMEKCVFHYLHLDVKNAPLLLNLLLDSCHGLVEDRQPLRALQSGGGHHVTWRSNQIDLQNGLRCQRCVHSTRSQKRLKRVIVTLIGMASVEQFSPALRASFTASMPS